MSEKFICDTCGWKEEMSLSILFSDETITTCNNCHSETVDPVESDYITGDGYTIISYQYC